MNSRMRSSEAPMDFTYTSRPSSQTKPVWASSGDDEHGTPKKRPHDAMNLSPPSDAPTFGGNQNIPFIFHTPSRQIQSSPYPWTPPPNFSSSKAFPTPAPASAPELRDVDMSEVSPPKPAEDMNASPEKADNGVRAVATGALRRVYRARQKVKGSRLAIVRSREDGSEGENDSDDDGAIIPHNTSNHYTLNMPSPAPPPSDIPYVLLGYLQFFFNFSLVLIFFYLLIQFILTVQRDVEHRISEYSMDIVQEIATCALQYKNNNCASPIPAMIHQCGLWETCMNRDPTKVGRARVGAELIAEVVNGFVEPITWKTLIFTLTSLSFLTVFINTLLSLYRSRHRPSSDTQPQMPAPHFPAPHQFGGYMSPMPPNRWRAEDETETPSRRRRLEGGAAVKVK
ncbi:nuclear membrane protein [Moniliophthora roreri MCA 2997]|uniref:Nuclear membrane protein n=2 Tax=Moniliophthora roreri TaxID=221103 RepID=V2XZ61_MONRO|nr:nuclear membrane protein [Moniliophthora roreri MCA 2997]KAI3621959.1 nuclear membrane protein [Moniliophthora roreri]